MVDRWAVRTRAAPPRGTFRSRLAINAAPHPLSVMKAETENLPAMDLDDAKLLAAYRRGDAEALGRLVEKYKRPLFGFLARFAANPGQTNK